MFQVIIKTYVWYKQQHEYEIQDMMPIEETNEIEFDMQIKNISIWYTIRIWITHCKLGINFKIISKYHIKIVLTYLKISSVWLCIKNVNTTL